MWSLYEWFYSVEDKSSASVAPGPARNMPDMARLLKERKLTLKSPIIISELKEMSNLTENVLSARNKLKHVEVPPRQTEWPCINPLFHELRDRARKLHICYN